MLRLKNRHCAQPIRSPGEPTSSRNALSVCNLPSKRHGSSAIVDGYTEKTKYAPTKRIAGQRRYPRGRYKPYFNTQILNFLTKKLNRQKRIVQEALLRYRPAVREMAIKREKNKTQKRYPCPVSPQISDFFRTTTSNGLLHSAQFHAR